MDELFRVVDAEQNEGNIGDLPRNKVKQVQARGITSVEVVEHDQERFLSAQAPQ